MEEIVTDDGSITFRHPKHLEPYHTKAGAIVEALEKHARTLRVWEKKDPIIFDVCSGLSYSAACALEEIRSHGNESFVTIYLFENDRKILEKNLELPDKLNYSQEGENKHVFCYSHFKNAIREYLDAGSTVYNFDNIRIIIVFGDFREEINSLKQNADYIFYAPFSPIISPDLWDYTIFKILFDKMDHGGKLSTYSYARSVRDALTKVGFVVEKGPTLGRRSPSLIAIKK